MSHAWFTYPFHSSATAVWRIRTSKSFPTDRLATGYITILSIRLSASQYTAIYQEAYVFTQGRSSPMLHLENWWSEIRTHEPEGTDLQSACFVHLHIHQYRRCVFAELSSPIKQVPWFFMRILITALTFGYSLSLPVLRKDTELNHTTSDRRDSNPWTQSLAFQRATIPCYWVLPQP